MENQETVEQQVVRESPTMAARNDAICAFYQQGLKPAEIASRFRLGRQRVVLILKQRGIWRPYEKGKRNKFLGVTVSEETKEGLTKLAQEKGVSVSKLTSDLLDETVSRG